MVMESTVAQDPSDSLSVMTFNVLQLPQYLIDWDQTQRRQYIPDTILSLAKTNQQPDVIIFNEAIDPNGYGMFEALKDVYPHQTPIIGKQCDGKDWDKFERSACSNSPFVVSGGVKIVSKYPIVTKMGRVYQASVPFTGDYYANKGAIYARIEKSPGLTYSVIGTHLQADENNKPGKSVRMQQLQELNDWIRRLNIGADEPIIIAGDLNVELSKQKDCNDMVTAIQADITCDQYKQSLGPNHSYSTKTNVLAKASGGDYEDTLDYVFSYSPGRKPASVDGPHVVPMRSSEPMHWSYLSRKRLTSDGIYHDLSDHSAVYSTFVYDRS